MKTDPIIRIRQDLSVGKHAAAFKKARIEVRKHPADPLRQNIAGICLAEAGDHLAAIAYFRHAVRLDPENLDYNCNLIFACTACDKFAAAEAAIEKISAKYATHPRLAYLRAFICLQRHELTDAISWATKAISQAPDLIEAYNVRGIARADLNEHLAALSDFQEILKRNPADILAHENSGERLNELGRYDEARNHYRSILKIAPQHGYAMSRLADLEPHSQLPSFYGAVERALSNRPKSADDRALLHMAAGSVQNRLGKPDVAMGHFDKAHDLDARNRLWNPAPSRKTFEHITGLFRDIDPVELPDAQPHPIFIVGLPRSGTTLVELILTAAPDVASCGELSVAGNVFDQLIRDRETVDAEVLGKFAQSYLGQLPDVARGARAFVDKMPSNYRFVGLLLAAFPNARVINVERDPRDVALSMWKQRFSADAMNYTHRLSTIAEQANLYRKYMDFWTPRCDGRLLTLRYEELVSDPMRETKRIARHCLVDWTETMLHPDESKAIIRTASMNQARRKIDARSIGGWREFPDRFREFTKTLDPALWHLEDKPTNR